jgi:hypothetical protein
LPVAGRWLIQTRHWHATARQSGVRCTISVLAHVSHPNPTRGPARPSNLSRNPAVSPQLPATGVEAARCGLFKQNIGARQGGIRRPAHDWYGRLAWSAINPRGPGAASHRIRAVLGAPDADHGGAEPTALVTDPSLGP